MTSSMAISRQVNTLRPTSMLQIMATTRTTMLRLACSSPTVLPARIMVSPWTSTLSCTARAPSSKMFTTPSTTTSPMVGKLSAASPQLHTPVTLAVHTTMRATARTPAQEMLSWIVPSSRIHEMSRMLMVSTTSKLVKFVQAGAACRIKTAFP